MPVALRRFRELTGNSIHVSQTVIIGDTPSDVECAKVHGIRAVAVATGPFAAGDLADADVVLADLKDIDAVVHHLLDGHA